MKPPAAPTNERVERIELAGGGVLTLIDPWLDAAEADRLFGALRSETPWRQEVITVLGKPYLQPRLTAWYGDPEAAYSYSGISLEPLAWTAELAALRARVEEAARARFNAVLLNYYRSGDDAVGFHADAEKELGEHPVIASVSLGCTRRFVMRWAGKGPPAAPIELDLRGGSLLVMGGTTQRFWRHAVPRRRGQPGERINLTFRTIFTRP